MSILRFGSSSSGALLAAAFFTLSACYDADGCDFTACEHDFDCGSSEICESDGLGTVCIGANVCEDATDCPSGSECRIRTASQIPVENGPRNPFESDVNAKLTCEGLGASSSSSSSSTSSSSASSSTSSGSGSSSGTGGAGVTGSGGSGGGTGGSGGSGGSGGGSGGSSGGSGVGGIGGGT
jgi:hypothetical protein